MADIRVLGWGSLIWDPRTFEKSTQWHCDGPQLPIEFSRISNNGRLSLVVDEKHGTSTFVRSCRSPFESLELAIENLRVREGPTTKERIGYIDLRTGSFNEGAASNQPRAFDAVAEWARQRQCDAVIWTALGPKFLEGVDFSPDAAIQYLRSLPEATLTIACEYIGRAPAENRTPVRDLAEKTFDLTSRFTPC